MLTGDERFLEPWEAAQRALPNATGELEELTRVPVQHARARTISADIASYLETHSMPVVDAARRGDPTARSVATALEGKRHIDALRSEFDELRTAERELAATRQDRAEAATHQALVVAVAGLVGSVVLIAIFSAYLTRAIVLPVRRASAMAGRLAGGDLAVRMPENGVGEIATLERSFNTMARSLEASRAELTASRARVVAAGDEARRRIERDIHDGTQQRLVSLGLELRTAETMVPPGSEKLRARLADAAEGLADAAEDLHEISRGIHPAVLSRAASRPRSRRSHGLGVPIELDVRVDGVCPRASRSRLLRRVRGAHQPRQACEPSMIQVDVEATDAAVRL